MRLVIKLQQIDFTYLINRKPDPHAESLHVETAALLKRLVEWREHQSRVQISVSVKYEREYGQCRVYCRVAEHQEAVVDGNCHKVEKDDEDGLDDRNDKATMEHELGEDSRATIGKSAMPQNKLLELTELLD